MHSIRLRNFRSILDTGRIELGPITVLVGANSSGKSSFLRFFPLLRQTVETPTQSPLLWYTDKGYVDLGSFSQVGRRGAEPREIGIEFEIETKPWGGAAMDVKASTALVEEQGRTHVIRCNVEAPKTSCVMAFDGAGNATALRIDNLDILLHYANFTAKRAPSPLIPGVASDTGTMPGPLLEAIDMLDETRIAIDRFAKGIRYIGPSRVTPERYYRVQEVSVQQIAPQGENLAMFLRALPQPHLEELSSFVHEHLGISVRLYVEGGHVSILLDDGSGETFNLIDMGYGFSQVLPVVAQAWASASGFRASERGAPSTLLAIEQPELHLHPRHQARLADMLVGVVNASRATPDKGEPVRVIVETHSETLINRLGELIELGSFAAKDVLVLLFEKDARTGVTSVRQSRFAQDGTLMNWPIGFFAP